MPPAESALVVLVPEAEAVVRPFREQHDPSARAGVPAHITLLYPFKPPGEIDPGVLDSLEQCFARSAPFGFSLAAVCRFPGVLYVAPEPAQPFRQLTLAIWALYPETPPYGGKYPDIVPHLCVAQIADEATLDGVTGELSRAARGRLPIRARAAEVALMDTSSGCWRVRTTFRLGRRDGPDSCRA